MDDRVGLRSAEGIGSGGMNDAPLHIPCFLIDDASMSTGASLRPCCHFSTLERWLGERKDAWEVVAYRLLAIHPQDMVLSCAILVALAMMMQSKKPCSVLEFVQVEIAKVES
ncbi:hypothetical protein C4D60_Mb03t20660 [Musa balbisiana]|uniref:Uncharacterized protein n=1 Tax=Musa balbisiana TaxID=52838 RepID=A0A4S8JBC5_MUSBA|nr:hypothetical protein C4D60_Mb03t20660 [Musa balbisiana]